MAPDAGAQTVDPWDRPAASQRPVPTGRRATRTRRGWRRRRTAAVLFVAALMLIATVVFAVPVQRVQYEWFTLGGSCGGAGENQTFPESGTFYFLWRSSSVDGANLIVRDPVGAAIYNEDNVTGTGEFAVTAGESFLFQVYCSAPQNVTVTGTLHFVGPML